MSRARRKKARAAVAAAGDTVETPIHLVIYASGASVPFDSADLHRLLAVSRRNNAELGVTGVLLFHEGAFLQVLEGPEEAVERLYDRIRADGRHHDCRLLFRGDFEERRFDGWSMGFVRLRADEVASVPGFVDFFRSGVRSLDLVADAPRVIRVLEGFAEGRWHDHTAA